MSSSAGTVPIRPQKLSPQRLSTSCVLLAPAPAGSRPAQVTMAPRGPRRALPPPPSRALKRGGVYSAYVPSPQPTTVLRRNARERNRVKQVNHGFIALRNHIPGAAKNKKLSKVDTLRHAMEYIQSLQQQLEEHSESRWAPEQQPSPAYQSHPRETHFSGYLAGEESPPASLPSPGRHLTPPGYMPRHEEQHGGYLTPQSSPLPCQSSPLILTPSSLASVDSGVCVSEPLGYPAGPPQSGPDTPSPMPPGAYEGPDPAGYVYSEELACHEPDTDFNPEDEELLDAIAWWQTSQ